MTKKTLEKARTKLIEVGQTLSKAKRQGLSIIDVICYMCIYI